MTSRDRASGTFPVLTRERRTNLKGASTRFCVWMPRLPADDSRFCVKGASTGLCFFVQLAERKSTVYRVDKCCRVRVNRETKRGHSLSSASAAR